MDLERLSIGVIGALVGVIGWLLVGLYIQRRAHEREAREAARAVYFELAAWIPIEELQAVCVAYLGHAGYDQVGKDPAIPPEVRRHSLRALHDAHRVATALLRGRAFTPAEVSRLAEHLRPDQISLMKAADAGPSTEPIPHPEATRARA